MHKGIFSFYLTLNVVSWCSFMSLGIYTAAFQLPFLTQTNEFYAAEGLQRMASSDAPDYLAHSEVRSNECSGQGSFIHFWLCDLAM